MTTITKPLTLNDQNFEQEVLQSQQPVLVDFWAEWCSPCRAIAPVIDEIAADFENAITVGKVDVDVNNTLAEQYGIQSIPTLLFFQNGKEAGRIIGVTNKDEITVKIQSLL